MRLAATEARDVGITATPERAGSRQRDAVRMGLPPGAPLASIPAFLILSLIRTIVGYVIAAITRGLWF